MKCATGAGRLRILAASLGILAFCLSGIATDRPKQHRPNAGFNAEARPSLVENYGKLPLSFELNTGQTDARAKFLSRGIGYSLFLTTTEAVLSLHKPNPSRDREGARAMQQPLASARGAEGRAVVRMKLAGANPSPRISGVEELSGKSNYFIGKDPKKWRRKVPTYARVKYEDVYPGVDLVYYGNQRQLEYDFVVAPGADPRAIKLAIQGSNRLRLNGQGDLSLEVKGGELRLHKPFVYQKVGGARQNVAGHFVIRGAEQVGFEVARYDTSKPLVIDPVLTYSTYLGAGTGESAHGIAVDGSGNAYVTGVTSSTDFPTPNGWDTTHNGGSTDAFVAKISADGSTLLYSTYLGGSELGWTDGGAGFSGPLGDDRGNGIAVDGSGNAYVVGLTSSRFFPTQNAFQPENGTNGFFVFDAFVAKISADGSTLLYSTYLGGGSSDSGAGIAVDGSGNAYVTGSSTCSGGVEGFPTRNAYQDSCSVPDVVADNAFVAKLDTTESGDSSLVYSTLLGGNNQDEGNGIAVDGSGIAYVTGETNSTNFPTVDALYAFAGLRDAFVAKIGADGSTLLYSTYLGGSDNDFGNGIARDGSGNIYVTGEVRSSDFPTANAICGSGTGSTDAFITKISGDGSTLLYSTYLGGDGVDIGYGIAADGSGNAYVTGATVSRDFPIKGSAPQNTFGGEFTDGFVTKFKADGSALVYSTYLGGSGGTEGGLGCTVCEVGFGIAVDGSGNAYVAGDTDSADFPKANALQSVFGGGVTDAFVAKLEFKPDFFFSPISPITLNVGGSGPSPVVVNSFDDFSSAVSLSASAPSGITGSFSPTSVTPPSGGSTSSTLTVALGPSVTSGSYTLTVTGTSGSLTHSTPEQVTVQVTSGGTSTVIGTLQAVGCIDNSGISNALTSKLAAAQAAIDAGKIQTAINTLTALLNQLNAQKGKHITTSCTVNGVTFDPVQVLIDDVKALLAGLGVNLKANPIMGNVVNSSKVGISGTTVSILNSTKTVVAKAETDVTGFYFFPVTGGLATGANYTVKVSVPKGYKNATPASQTFTWRGTAVILGNFVTN